MNDQPGEDPHYLERELRERFRSDPMIFDFLEAGSLDGIWYWDLDNPAHEWMSPHFWVTLGHDPATKQHLAAEWQSLIFPADLELARKNLEAHLADPKHPYDQLVRYWSPAGETVWVRCRGLAIRDASGKPVRMLGVHNDVTELQKIDELRRVQSESDRLAESNRDFLRIACHDLRSPLRSLKLLSEWIEEDARDALSETALGYLATMRGRVARLDGMLARLTEYSAACAVSEEPRSIDVDTVLEQAIASGVGDSGFEIRGSIEVGAMHIPANALCASVGHLLSNAIRHHHAPPGRIEVRAQRLADGALEVCIADDGPGIDPRFHDRVFDVFHTLKPRDELDTSGMGLSIARRLAQSYGGSVTLDSATGQGTTVVVRWPEGALPMSSRG